jgi:CheY-like chemotaxis protein
MQNEPIYILLTDDDEADRLLFAEAFSELKINTIIHTLNDGVQLMELLNTTNEQLPHLIFLDLNMPFKNGLQCLKEIRSNQKFDDIFIAIYSTSSNEKDIEDTFRNGANIYITKPSEFNFLKQVLEKAVMTTYRYRDNSMKKENFILKL